jgi:hypothetical protein
MNKKKGRENTTQGENWMYGDNHGKNSDNIDSNHSAFESLSGNRKLSPIKYNNMEIYINHKLICVNVKENDGSYKPKLKLRVRD